MNTPSLLAFDGLLLISILSLAWAALASRDARRSIILFMAFGLVLALAWGRLMAPDVALAEAAIGAGLSGALLLAAVRGLRGYEGPQVVALLWGKLKTSPKVVRLAVLDTLEAIAEGRRLHGGSQATNGY